ncbi:MAG: outer membrane beta-barrel protein [Pseudomonadota bacterium]
MIKLAVIALIMVAPALYAQTLQTGSYRPGNWQAGPVNITPELEVETRYVDNLFRTDVDEKSTWVLDTLPRVKAWIQDGPSTYALSAQLQDFRYENSSDDDFTDYQVNFDVHHEFNSRNAINVNAEYFDGHEQRGTGLTEGVIAPIVDEPIEFDRASYGFDYTYGGAGSKGRLVLAAKNVEYEYQNFREFTAFRDRDESTYSGTFFWKTHPRSRVLAEVRRLDLQYDSSVNNDGGGSLDSTEMMYLVGAEWDATSKTNGSIRLGRFDRDFDSGLREDSEGFQWEIDLFWRPRTYSQLNFETLRIPRETNGLGNFIDSRETSLLWDHDWSARSSTHFGVTFANDDYEGSERNDDRVSAKAAYMFNWHPNLKLGGGYRFEERDSDLDIFDYTLNEFFLEVVLGLR